MAMRSNGPIQLMLPAFRGVTRRIILIALVAFFATALLGLISAGSVGTVLGLVVLIPAKALHGLLWQFVTYPFVGTGLLSTAFALLTVWFFGSTTEDARGSRWFGEFFLVATIGGGLMAALVSVLLGTRLIVFSPDVVVAAGMWPFVLALVVVFGIDNAEQEITFNFIFKLKGKYLAAIFVVFYAGSALIGSDRFGAVVSLCNALAGFLYLRLAPRRGMRDGAAEQWFGLRNAYIRAKRKRAAKKFVVYMKRQGKDVSLDEDGRYIDPSGTPRDPNDKRWMN
jgi:membrane associated rhomboid family serine protease